VVGWFYTFTFDMTPPSSSSRLLALDLAIATVLATVENNPHAYPVGSQDRKDILRVLSRLISIHTDLKAKA
jgi:hypothetical protein